MKLKLWLALVLLLGSMCLAQAQTATSESYLFEMGELLDGGVAALGGESTSGAMTLPGYGGMLQGGMWLGFPEASVTASMFQMSIDNLQVDFGGLTPGMLSQRQNQLLINSNIPVGYRLYARQNHPLVVQGNVTMLNDTRNVIPDTTCDASDCTMTQAGGWNNQSTVGFGYTVQAADGLADFNNGSAYRSFAAASRNEEAQLLAQETEVAQLLANREVVVQYQVGVTSANVAGSYENAVSYTLIPNF